MTWTSPIPPSREEGDEEHTPSADEILSDLASPDLDDPKRRERILAAEVTRFDADQTRVLEGHLRRYIDRNLKCDLRDEIVAVGSAIRKLVAMQPVAELPRCEEWLRPERGLPPILEAEVAKMVARKLAATLPQDVAALVPLGDQLADLLQTYLNLRTLSKRYIGAASLEALVSLALMRSPRLEEVLGLLRRLTVRWFRAAVASEARTVRSRIETTFPGDRSREARRCLTEMTTAAESAQT